MNEGNILYTCEITFLRADHVPVADIRTFSCDPYISATLQAHSQSGYPEEQLTYRTHTMRNTLNPIFNARWIVSGIPRRGFLLTVTLIDEDTKDGDDKLGRTVVMIPNPQQKSSLEEEWDSGALECKIEKRKGSIQSHVMTYIAAALTRGDVSHHVRVWLKVRVLGKAADQKDKRLFTLGPPRYTRHFSPLIGHIISGGTAANKTIPKGKKDKPLGASTFIANRLQLRGPPPRALRLRYVGYLPIIQSLFNKRGIRGKILHYGLKRQFKTIYGYNRTTVYGVAGEGEIDTDASQGRKGKDVEEGQPPSDEDRSLQDINNPESYSEAVARQFLEMTSYGTAGRIFTYVITLDSEWRFTETGEEFSVDLLSKHSMHANAAKEIAISGEFFVRKIGEKENSSGDRSQDKERNDNESGSDTTDGNEEDHDPSHYELVIDNNSGTYRPQKELLPILQKWLAEEGNLKALGKVTVKDGFDETLQSWKKERQKEKRRAKGLKPKKEKNKDEGKGKNEGDQANSQNQTNGHAEEENGSEVEEGEIPKMVMPKRKKLPGRLATMGSIGSSRLGSGSSSVSSSDISLVLRENAKRAEDNKDTDHEAKEEEKRVDGGTA